MKRGHVLGHKANLIKFKIIQGIQNVFPHHTGIKLEINNKQISLEHSQIFAN